MHESMTHEEAANLWKQKKASRYCYQLGIVIAHMNLQHTNCSLKNNIMTIFLA
jgi:hypothetical protein